MKQRPRDLQDPVWLNSGGARAVAGVGAGSRGSCRTRLYQRKGSLSPKVQLRDSRTLVLKYFELIEARHPLLEENLARAWRLSRAGLIFADEEKHDGDLRAHNAGGKTVVL